MAAPAHGIKLLYNPRQEHYEEVSIRQLVNSPSNPSLHGVIIGKSDIQSVTTKRSTSRYVLGFTLRDSPNDTINASCWGEKDEVSFVKQMFTIGDVVKIKKAQVVSLRNSAADSQYKPYATSYFELKIIPANTEIEICGQGLKDMFSQYLRCPVRRDFMHLSELIERGNSMENMHATLLVAIKNIGPLEDVKTKDGRSLKKLQLLVYDQSGISLTVLIWSEEVAQFILKNCIKKSVLLISDIRINLNAFTKKTMATATKNTIFTPDPDMPEARTLYEYAQTHNNYAVQPAINSGQIDGLDVYTVAKLLRAIRNGDLTSFEDTRGIMIVFMSHLDIDGQSKIISTRCGSCKQPLGYSKTQCTNSTCDMASGMNSKKIEDIFDLMVNFTDHTGTLRNCSMQGQVVEDYLGCNVAQFHLLTEKEKVDLKWLFLLERAKVEFKISHTSLLIGTPRINIVSCCRIGLPEAYLFNRYIFS